MPLPPCGGASSSPWSEGRGPAKDALAGSIGELAREAGARLPDVQAFGTRLDGVIAALNTHLEQEQRLLRRIAH